VQDGAPELTWSAVKNRRVLDIEASITARSIVDCRISRSGNAGASRPTAAPNPAEGAFSRPPQSRPPAGAAAATDRVGSVGPRPASAASMALSRVGGSPLAGASRPSSRGHPRLAAGGARGLPLAAQRPGACPDQAGDHDEIFSLSDGLARQSTCNFTSRRFGAMISKIGWDRAPRAAIPPHEI
jgi:hypothetical protein